MNADERKAHRLATERRWECMARLGWSRRELSRRLGLAESSIRDWDSGRSKAWPEVGPWLERLVELVESEPAPRRE